MKTTLNKAIAILNMLIVSIFLDSCTSGEGNMIGATDSNTHKKNILVFRKFGRTLCPICQQGARYLCKLTNGEIILLCDECEALWPSPRNIGWGGAVSDRALKTMFGVENVEDLFTDSADWATVKEAYTSEWGELVEDNPELVKKEACLYISSGVKK